MGRQGPVKGSDLSPRILLQRWRTTRSERLSTKRSLRLFLLFIFTAPLAAQAGEPAWWTQQKQQCGLSSGLAYNTWVAQGSQCNTGGAGSGGFSPEQELGKAIGQALGQAIGEALRGNPEAEARRKAEAEAEERRLAEEIRKREEERRDRLLGGMIGIEDSSSLGLLDVDSGPELSLITGDQAETAPSWDRYREWEEYKRKVLAYQQLLTEKQPENRDNQRWCQGHIPLSFGPNSSYWGSRCNPTGEVKLSGRLPPDTKSERLPPRQVVPASPGIKSPAIAPIRNDGELKSAGQGGFDSSGLILGTNGAVPELPEFSPDAAVQAKMPMVQNEPAAVAAIQIETVRVLPVRASDSMGAAIPGIGQGHSVSSESLPPDVAPAIAAATGLKTTQKRIPQPVEGEGSAKNNRVAPASLPAKGRALPSSRKTPAEIQVATLSCAVSELQDLAGSMGKEGVSLRADVDTFLFNLGAVLKQPCSGLARTETVETLALSTLRQGEKKNEDHLEGNILMTRNETSCEVHLDVQHASSRKRDPIGIGNEGQNLIHIDKDGVILSAETTAAVATCLERLSIVIPSEN